jgi:hypothetical protein
MLTRFWALQRWKVCLMASMMGDGMSIGTVEVASLHREGAQQGKVQSRWEPFVDAALKEVQIQTRRGEGQGLSQR